MPTSALLLCLPVLLIAAWAPAANAEKKTVCTITVNSADEREAFRRSLPPDKYQFVELVERGRPDWLASACQQKITCDMLVISGHYDGGNEFFSDKVEAREYLPVDEMERASCSTSCGTLFSQLKEVYLFGCNTLNPERQSSNASDIASDLVAAGHSQADADRIARTLSARIGDSSRDRMRQIFPNVPVIYGFSSVAPLGPQAAFNLSRYLQSGIGEVGSGRPSSRLIGSFRGHSMAITSGLNGADPQASYRRDLCQFSDDRLLPEQKIAFVHRLLGREMAEVRLFLDRIERYLSVVEASQPTSAVSSALDEIARDDAIRMKYLTFTRNADPPVRARMLKLARKLDWLSDSDLRAEWMRLIGDRLAGSVVTSADVDLLCTLNSDHELDRELPTLQVQLAEAGNTGRAAVLACLGSPEAHARVLQAVTSGRDDDAQIARVYFRHRPITDNDELRAITRAIAETTDPKAQARALETLVDQRIADRESLEALASLIPVVDSAGGQSSIAGILLRSDYQIIATADLAQTLKRYRRKASNGDDMVDVLLRRLQAF